MLFDLVMLVVRTCNGWCSADVVAGAAPQEEAATKIQSQVRAKQGRDKAEEEKKSGLGWPEPGMVNGHRRCWLVTSKLSKQMACVHRPDSLRSFYATLHKLIRY